MTRSHRWRRAHSASSRRAASTCSSPARTSRRRRSSIRSTARLASWCAATAGSGYPAATMGRVARSPPLQRAQALLLRDLCSSANAIFIVNDDVDLAYAVDADGVHLGREDAPLARARQRLGRAAIIGASCYDSLGRAAAAVEAGADYI